MTYIAPKLIYVMFLSLIGKSDPEYNSWILRCTRILKALAGNDYYIESNRIESEYLASLANMDEEQMKDLFMQHKHEGNVYAVSLRKLTRSFTPG